MNIFLPYNDIQKSVESLDDLRLNKQILECRQIYLGSITKGYAYHPVTVYYSKYPFFVIRYGLTCCMEYFYRFGKFHVYTEFFDDTFVKQLQNATEESWAIPMYYAQYSKNDPRCIRTTENVDKLFQEKLANKWMHDKQVPRWTKRSQPEFLRQYLLEKSYNTLSKIMAKDPIDGKMLKDKFDKIFENQVYLSQTDLQLIIEKCKIGDETL